MAKGQLKRRPPVELKPQEYQHRIEIAIEALFHATIGVNMLVRFLRQQQTPNWRRLQLLDTAAGDFRQAIHWLGKKKIRG